MGGRFQARLEIFVNNKPAQLQDNEKVNEFVKEIADTIDSIGSNADIGNVSEKNTFFISVELKEAEKIEYTFKLIAKKIT